MFEKETRVRVKADAFYGKVGRVTSLPLETEDHRYGVTLDGEEWLFDGQDLQELTVGTRVVIEVEIRDFSIDHMMVAGGWMPLDRILRIVEEF